VVAALDPNILTRAAQLKEGHPKPLPSDGAAFLTDLKEEVHEITVALADRIPTNTEARVQNGKLALEALEAVQLPTFAEEIRQGFAGMLPLVT